MLQVTQKNDFNFGKQAVESGSLFMDSKHFLRWLLKAHFSGWAAQRSWSMRFETLFLSELLGNVFAFFVSCSTTHLHT